MKAAQIGRYSKTMSVAIREVAQPEISDSEVLVRVKAAAVNPVDLLISTGSIKLIQNYPLPLTLGNECSGKRFDENFADFRDRFGITDMYSGGFYPFPDLETYWAWWSRAILLNRYEAGVGKPYLDLLRVLEGRDYFVLTTNVDHQFQLAGFDKARLFYTQGDYGLFQCSRNCSSETYDNEEQVREMASRQKDQRVPSGLVPRCPHCGAPMVPNLRVDGTFCEDRGWHEAASRYHAFCEAHSGDRVLYLELGVGDNTPVIIKYPFWNAVGQNGHATYACVNIGGACAPAAIAGRSILVDGDIGEAISRIAPALGTNESNPDIRCEPAGR